ncbi:hypothetical protein UPYG_G00016300, partial [Umbra pygmaea]
IIQPYDRETERPSSRANVRPFPHQEPEPRFKKWSSLKTLLLTYSMFDRSSSVSWRIVSSSSERNGFHTNSTSFLGYVMAEGKFMMDQAKVTAALDWPTPDTRGACKSKKVLDLESIPGGHHKTQGQRMKSTGLWILKKIFGEERVIFRSWLSDLSISRLLSTD